MLNLQRMIPHSFIFIVTLLGFSDQLGAESSAAQQLTQQLTAIQSMQADFTQRVVDERGELLQEASGKVWIQRPRRLLWSTQEPYHHQIMTDGETLWMIDYDLDQISRKPFTEPLDMAPGLLLSGDVATIVKHYRVSTQRTSDSEQQFILLPNDEASVFQSMALTFRNQKPHTMRFTDHMGQQTTIQFRQVTLNVSLDTQLFRFVPPAGVEVIEIF